MIDFMMTFMVHSLTSLLFMFTVFSQHTYGLNIKCVGLDIKDSSPRRSHSFQIEDYKYDIILESSERAGHQLVTNVFAIFLHDVLGYEPVRVSTYADLFDTRAALDRLKGEEDPTGRLIAKTTINLAVWPSPDIDFDLSQGYIEKCGHLGFPGRFGWFIPESNITRDHPEVDYWRTFQRNQSSLTSQFSLRPEDWENVTRLSINPETNQHFCTDPEVCRNGVFEPEICKNRQEQFECAVLLASYPESSSFVTSQIKSLSLYVKVVWIGQNLESFVRHLNAKYNSSGESKGVLFFSWKPTVLTTELNLVSVNFPACNSNESYCNYESHKVEKMVWSKLEEGAKLAFEAVHRFQFTQEEYVNFLKLYTNTTTRTAFRNSHESYEYVACEWMKANKGVWKAWKPSQVNIQYPLHIGGIFPISGSYTARGVVTAATMAEKAVNVNDSILSGYKLNLLVSDGQCRTDAVMKSFIDYIRTSTFDTMAGILGPACSDTVEPLAGVAKHFKTVVISYSAEGSSYSDREQYPYFFRTIGENKQFQHVYLKLFQELGWSRIASLTEEGQKYAEYISHLHDLLQENGMTFIASRKFPRERPALNMSQYLQDLRDKRARIILGDFYDHTARAVMCEAFRQKMTAKEGYVWFLPVWFNPDWYDTDKYNNISGKEPTPCRTAEMVQAINGHLSLQYAYYAPDDHIMQENRTVGEWRADYEKQCKEENRTTSDYAGYAYDAVWTYAYALDKLLRLNQSHITNLHSDNITETFVQLINETDFYGVSGHIKFIGGPSRVSTIHVVQWLERKTMIVGSFQPVTRNMSNDIIGGRLDLNISAIVWLNQDNSIPSDGSEPPATCVLETLASALDVSCEAAIVIANVIGFGVFGCILVVCFIIIKRRYDKHIQTTEDYFKALGIDILSATSVSALDKWEIPRDRVVINRKLGEGAFGTVYGGECFFDDKGWVAVAVKTLKVGSTCEQKLDFLSEAEVMKRFEHKNIIKLLGVCTRSEPIYTIMEFCLYGDLKTYLLARRNLVNENEDSDEISSKRLTSMTLDLARALSYLAELKYVHRDVACRNCLVNASRVVKLGDFGMTRPMYENDYYRFNRKGMLPVRWMAPESLELGIFTPMSDVYSFGVVLYEIITFGSFPFQGLSNNQVLEHVKAGNQLPIPRGVQPQLEALLRSCYAMESARRPAASEIVEFLANNPRIISPCLDIPLASVQMEGTDQLEISIPKKPNSTTTNRLNSSKNIRQCSSKLSSFETQPQETIPLTQQTNQNNTSPYATLQHNSHSHSNSVDQFA